MSGKKMGWIHTLMPSCRDVARRLSMGDMDRLALVRRLSMKLHLSLCHVCGPLARQLEILGKAFNIRFGGPEDSQALQKLKKRLKNQLK